MLFIILDHWVQIEFLYPEIVKYNLRHWNREISCNLINVNEKIAYCLSHWPFCHLLFNSFKGDKKQLSDVYVRYGLSNLLHGKEIS